ncbi:MAG: dTMP kinase [Gammaproteobacteria bacterium]|nr:MAG: dTMP kinase [Gammaproteobacteria bacterium]RLA36478.1 MAG: dTMP kinase [Gammaproteobacteria bacterium]
MVRGKFITVEGSEGVGKSTNVDFLASAIKDHGYEVICTREPGGTPIAERIRQILLEHGEEPLPDIAELLLFFASRSLHISNKIRPALEAGKWVICDRFTDASRAYQGAGRGLDMERINLLADWVQDDLQPDMTLLLDAPAEIGMQRAQQRGETDRLESEQISFYERVRAGYLALAEANPGRYRVVDAARPLQEVQVSIGAVLEQIFSDNSD